MSEVVKDGSEAGVEGVVTVGEPETGGSVGSAVDGGGRGHGLEETGLDEADLDHADLGDGDGDGDVDDDDDDDAEFDDDGVPPSRRRVSWPVAALVALVVAVLAGGGGYLAGHAGSSASTPSTTSADAGFARDMAIHHQQAIDLAFTLRDETDDPNLRLLAFDIINTQANQRGMMLGWLAQWNLPVYDPAGPMAWMGTAHTMTPGGPLMPGMATDAQLAQFKTLHGKDAEIMFLKLMIAHHKGGVEMAQAYIGLGKNSPELRLAQTIIDSQLGEIRAMSDMLTALGAAR